MDNKESAAQVKKRTQSLKLEENHFKLDMQRILHKVKCLQHSGLTRLSGLREEAMPYEKYSAKQKKIANVAPPFNKITGADFAMLQKKKKKKKKGK